MSTEPTVFVVDDDQAVREMTGRLMRSVGYTTEIFSSAEDFLSHYEAGRSGCLLVDVRMPGMDGMELQEELRRRRIHLPVIIITGHGEVPLAIRALKAGTFDFIEKPFREQVILETIKQAIHHDARSREVFQQRDEIRHRLALLTEREREVLDLVVSGKLNKEIAADLGVSIKAIEAHRARIMRKMQARTSTELVRIVVEARPAPSYHL